MLRFCIGRWFEFVLCLGVTTPLIVPFMGIIWVVSFGNVCFDMLKSIEFCGLVRLFSSLMWCHTLIGWFVWDLVGRLFKMQPLRRSVKAHYYLTCLWENVIKKGTVLQIQPSFLGEKTKTNACIIKSKEKFFVSLTDSFPWQENNKTYMKTWIYQRKEIKVLYFSINAVSQARSQKSMRKKKLWVYQQSKIKILSLIVNPVSQVGR